MKVLDFRILILTIFTALCSFLFVRTSPLLAQSNDEEVRTAIEKVDKGQSEEIRKQLPDLVSKHQNTPGIIYLQGRIATDGIEAVKFYQGVVDNFPKSEWADDALYRIYQYYYSLGLYRTADFKLQQLKKDYPNSPYVTGKMEVGKPEEEEKPVKLPEKEVVVADTQEAVKPVQAQEQVQAPPAQAREPYTVQTGAFTTVANAEKQKKNFDDLGYKVEVTNKIRNGRNLYLVWVGSFKTVDEARDIVREIKRKYKLDSMIVERY
jgi:cell division septation protein DedD